MIVAKSLFADSYFDAIAAELLRISKNAAVVGQSACLRCGNGVGRGCHEAFFPKEKPTFFRWNNLDFFVAQGKGTKSAYFRAVAETFSLAEDGNDEIEYPCESTICRRAVVGSVPFRAEDSC